MTEKKEGKNAHPFVTNILLKGAKVNHEHSHHEKETTL